MGNPWIVLTANVIGFVVCFAAWVMNGILVTFLVQQGIFAWNEIQIGLLLSLPILTGSITRLPLGILTDRYGGRIMFTLVLLLSAAGLWLVSLAHSYVQFAAASLLFGIAGGSFAVGVAYVSAFFEKSKQGFALGIFGSGNLGAGLTTLFAPALLQIFTDHGNNLEGWRHLPQLYAAILAAAAVLYYLATVKKVSGEAKTLRQLIEPLTSLKAYRYSFYYFILFGGYVGLSQWLIVYYVSAYGLSLVTAGLLVSSFSIPCSLMRIVGGKLSDLFGAKKILGISFLAALILVGFLSVPIMEIQTPGKGVLSSTPGTVAAVDESRIEITSPEGQTVVYPLTVRKPHEAKAFQIFPSKESWQEPAIAAGDAVYKNQLIAKGYTRIYFQANVAIFAAFTILLGLAVGIGMAAVFKAIPEQFPATVGVVGGTVGMIGSLGGFVYPLFFAVLLQWTGFWTVCWLLFLSLIFIAMRMVKWKD